MCGVQVPFARGGSELLLESLTRELRERGHEVETISIPFKWYPPEEVPVHALAWRLLDLTESQGHTVDLLIGTKFPSYLARHPRKVAWLFHQFRQAYDLRETAFDELAQSAGGQAVVDAVHRMDAAAFRECRAVYTISANVSDRLRRYNGVTAGPLYPPPPLGDRYRCEGYGDFLFFAGRLESMKRIDLLLRAIAVSKTRPRCVIAGRGPETETLRRLALQLGLEHRVEFVGWITEQALLDLYATARAVYYAPYDEDYGFVTLEAFRSRKPVLTCSDSGGVLEWVTQGETGTIADPEPHALASAIDRLMMDSEACKAMGAAGYERARTVTWEGVIGPLLSAP